MLLMIDARPVLRHSDQKFARRPQVYRRFALGAYRGASSLARGAAGPTGCAGEPSELFRCLLSALISASAMAGQVEARRRARTAPGHQLSLATGSYLACTCSLRFCGFGISGRPCCVTTQLRNERQAPARPTVYGKKKSISRNTLIKFRRL